jgi:chemotaxis protein MotB
MNHRRLVGALAALALLTGGCVTSGTHEKKVAELNQALERENQQRAELGRLQAELAESRKKHDDAVDELSSERGRLSAGLEDAQKRLEELRLQKASAEARAAVFRSLIDKLRSMIDAGQLKVTIRNGRMLIVLPNDVLFDSGKTDLKQAGKAALTQVALALATIGDRRFLVAGHTDNAPIKTARFPSNWELSTARAVEVARLLISGGMKPQVLGAAGYAEFDPVASNDDPQTKAQNRRIEIILEPNLSDLPNLESLLTESRK